MNKIIKDDLIELLNRYKRAKTDREKIKCAKDLSNIFDAAELLQSDIKSNITIPANLVYMFSQLDELMVKEKDDITKQIYNNLDTLEELYTTFLNEFNKYGFTYNNLIINKDIDIDLYHNFFKRFGNMDDEFNKVINNEQLFMVEGNHAGSTINFKVLDKQYVFVPIDNYIYTARAIAHEMGHVHAFNITYDDNIDDYNFLTEFMSFLIELSFFNYEEANIDRQNNINLIFVLGLLVYQSLGQVRLMKKYPNAFTTFKLNPKYEKELDEILSKLNYKYQRTSLYSQIYTIDYLLAFSFYYQLKYGVDFNEIEKFYIENTCKNDLKSILSNIDMDAFRQYLQELYNKKRSK